MKTSWNSGPKKKKYSNPPVEPEIGFTGKGGASGDGRTLVFVLGFCVNVWMMTNVNDFDKSRSENRNWIELTIKRVKVSNHPKYSSNVIPRCACRYLLRLPTQAEVWEYASPHVLPTDRETESSSGSFSCISCFCDWWYSLIKRATGSLSRVM